MMDVSFSFETDIVCPAGRPFGDPCGDYGEFTDDQLRRGTEEIQAQS